MGFPETDGNALSKKWYCLFCKYKEAKNLTKETRKGLTPEESAQGLTLEDKLDSICAYFYRWDALLGTRANVTPPAIFRSMGFQNHDMATISTSEVPNGTATLVPPVPCPPAANSPTNSNVLYNVRCDRIV
ncbi:unnamed protein product [Calypogeia fissa]